MDPSWVAPMYTVFAFPHTEIRRKKQRQLNVEMVWNHVASAYKMRISISFDNWYSLERNAYTVA